VKRRWIALFAVTLLFAGCGMPNKVLKDGKQMAVTIAEMKKFVAERESGYSKMLAGEQQWLAPYANREKWQDKITEAKAETTRLESIYNTQLKPLLEEDKRDSESKVTNLVKQLGTGLDKAKDLARYPSIRAGELETAKATAPKINEEALAAYTSITVLAQPLLKYISGVRSAHRDIDTAIQSRTGAAQKLADEAAQASGAIQTQFANRLAGRETDYALFADAAKQLNAVRKTLPTEDSRIRRECAELDQSWSRTLIDMKQQFFVQVSQVSWQESESIERPFETQYTHPWLEVSEAVFNQLDEWPDNQPIAELRSGFFGGFSPKLSEQLLSVLKLSPEASTEGFPSGDNEADYDIEALRIDHYHRYTEEQNGVITETDWIPVSAEFYEDHYNDLGMALKAKPYGRFADEVEEEAAPAGMAYVGDTRYGRWRNGAGGTSFWEFYGKYALFQSLLGMSHPGYSRTEWGEYRTYRDRDAAYYGGTNTAPRYGSASSTVQTNPRYAGSTFGRTGGFQTAQSEVRSAGVSTRGGGPGGGGK
jgi:hypothetical protein